MAYLQYIQTFPSFTFDWSMRFKASYIGVPIPSIEYRIGEGAFNTLELRESRLKTQDWAWAWFPEGRQVGIKLTFEGRKGHTTSSNRVSRRHSTVLVRSRRLRPQHMPPLHHAKYLRVLGQVARKHRIESKRQVRKRSTRGLDIR